MGSPSERRKFIDWIAFYLYPDFYSHWGKYQKILSQRNVCLRLPEHRKSLDFWTNELCKLQPILFDYRTQALNVFLQCVETFKPQLLPDDEIGIELTSGYPNGTDFSLETLLQFHKDKQESDIRSARTLNGAHVANVKIHFNDQLAQNVVSRGQLKMLTTLLVIAQSYTSNEKAIFAFDDFTSEIDASNQTRLLSLIADLSLQVLITSTTQSILDETSINAEMFHVKHGKFEKQS